MNQRKRIAILFGGRSVEHQVSLRSAKNIIDHLDPEKYESVLVGIDQGGTWYHLSQHTFDINEGEPIGVRLTLGKDVFFRLKDQQSLGEIDMVFPILHGNDGEDGSIQGLLRTLDIPFVGTGVLGSSVAFDKLCTKKLLEKEGIPTAPFLVYRYEDKDQLDFRKSAEALGKPFFIKPVASGSSVGVFKVGTEASFQDALDQAFQYDNVLLAEQFVDGREVECAVTGNTAVETTLPGEIVIVGEHDFYSFDAKYVDDKGARLDMPADLSEEEIRRVRTLAKQAYQALYCEDFARVDMFLTAGGEILINEVNTIPGFTHISMFPQLWTLSGISYTDLISRLIDLAFEKHAQQARIRRDYQSGLS